MPRGKKQTATTRANKATSSKITQFARKRPMLIATIGLALGALVGSLFSLTPEEKEMLGKRAGKLKDQANKLKDSVSELAMESYEQVQSGVKAASDTLTVSGNGGSTKSVEENPLVINDSAR